MASDGDFGAMIESGSFWAVALAAIAGFMGWRIGTAKDSVRVEIHEQRIKELQQAMEGLRSIDASEAKDAAVALAQINTTLQSMAEILARLDARTTKLEERQ